LKKQLKRPENVLKKAKLFTCTVWEKFSEISNLEQKIVMKKHFKNSISLLTK